MPHPLRRRPIEPLPRLPWPAAGRHRLSEGARRPVPRRPFPHVTTSGVEVVA